MLLFGPSEHSQICSTSYKKDHSLTTKICMHFATYQGAFSVMMLSLSVVIIELVALSHLKVGVSVDQSALLVLATCFPAVIGPNTPKKPPYADGVLHKHHKDGCDACANPVIYRLHSFFLAPLSEKRFSGDVVQ